MITKPQAKYSEKNSKKKTPLKPYWLEWHLSLHVRHC